jgi:CRP-like cAMP-binding protein
MFYDLLDREVEIIISDCRVIRYDKADAVLKEGDLSKDLTIVVDGKVDLKRGDGTYITLGPGSLFGELLLLNDDKVAADVIANSKIVDILEIPFDKIHSFYGEDLRTYAILMANLAKMLAKRLKRAGETIQKIKDNS